MIDTSYDRNVVVMHREEILDLPDFAKAVALPPAAIVTSQGGFVYGYRKLTARGRRNMRDYFEFGDRVTIAIDQQNGGA